MSNIVSELINRGLPKWPQMIVTGDPVSQEQAMEIIRRTDVFFGCGRGGNDHAYENWVVSKLNYPVVSAKSNGMEEINSFFRMQNEWRRKWGYIETCYVNNSWISTCYVGGPHGWCHPDGTIGYAENIGKWPSVEEVYDDWVMIAEAFPYLRVEVTLMSDEKCDENAVPVVSILVRDGKASLVDPDNYDIHDENGRQIPEPNEITDLFNRRAEKGLPRKQIEAWAEQMKSVVGEQARKYIVGRPINGISLNDLEYIQDDDGEMRYFDSIDEAKQLLREHGYSEEDFEDYLVFIESEDCTCFRCGSPLFKSDISDYRYQCFHCDEDFYAFEQEGEND